MATLKSLVDETTDIKDELKSCHSNLKNTLIGKGVECSDTDKMSSLIDKVEVLGLVASSQSGVADIGASLTSFNVNISEVDLSKSICYCRRNTTTSSQVASRSDAMVSFNSNKELNFKRYGTGGAGNVFWEVIEFKSGIKSVFNTLLTFSSYHGIGTYTHNLNYENPAKCVAFYSYNTQASSTNPPSVSIHNLQSNSFDYSVLIGGPYINELNVFIVEFL